MKLTFVGHASWLAQSATTTVASDLLIENSFRNGTFTICPTREMNVEAIPKLDALIITHRHRDHFDLETLVRLDRSTPILCPEDPVILHALARFGYEHVEQFSDWSHHKVGDLELIFTPSDNRVPENGFLVSEGETVFWNHVDTVISAQTIETIRENVGTVDLVAHGYQPMLETAALEAASMQFPFAAYSSILQRAKLLEPRALVPGSNGYRTAGAQAWFNAYKFPVSRERFVRDVGSILPETATFIPNAGDVMELHPDGWRTRRQGAQGGFVRTPVDDAAELMAFDPSREKPRLHDENPRAVSQGALRDAVRTIFETRVPLGCKKLGRFHALRVLRALLEVRVVFPSDAVESWIIDLSGEEPRVTPGSAGDESDFVMTITASGLHGLATGHTRPDIVALSGQFRLYSRAYRVDGSRLVTALELAPPNVHRQRSGFPWLLFKLIGFERDFEARQVDAEIDRLLGADGGVDRFLWERPVPAPLPARLAAPAKKARAFEDADETQAPAPARKTQTGPFRPVAMAEPAAE